MSPVPAAHDGHRSATMHYMYISIVSWYQVVTQIGKSGKNGDGNLGGGRHEIWTYGGLGTCVCVSDGYPLTTVSTAVVERIVDCADVVRVAVLASATAQKESRSSWTSVPKMYYHR